MLRITNKHAIREAINVGFKIDSVQIPHGASDARTREIVELAQKRGISVLEEKLQPAGKNRRGDEESQGVSAMLREFPYADFHRILDNAGPKAFLLALDHIQDPRNLGAILRTAAAAGVQGLFLETRRCCEVTAAVFDTSSGGAARVPVARVSNLAQIIEALKKKNIWITGADEAAETTHYQHDFTLPTCLVLGSEGEGLARLVRERCDFLVRVDTNPDFPTLNVSVAAAALLFEARRQRMTVVNARK